MGGRKKFPPLSKHLDQAIGDLGLAFGISINKPARRRFIDDIRREHDHFYVIRVDENRSLCWSREKGRRTIIFQSGDRDPGERERFNTWKASESVVLLEKRGVVISRSHASSEEIRAAAETSGSVSETLKEAEA